MKKFIALSIITGVLVSSTSLFSMLVRRLGYEKHLSVRTYHTNKRLNTMTQKKFLDVSETEISKNSSIFLESVHERNKELYKLLQEQENIAQRLVKNIKQQDITAINYTYNDEPLDIKKLKLLEFAIKEDHEKHSLVSFRINQLILEAQYKGHPNE